jgi:conjugative relaxase-like TrwC/TraI family protein
VLTTHKIPGDSAVTYAHYLTSTSSRGDYYAGDGEEQSEQELPSEWHGPAKLLSGLGLTADRPVDRRDLSAVMQGFSPRDGKELRPAGSDGTRVAAIEQMFAPPKTVSALWAVSDSYHRAQIEAAHRDAVASALKRTEREVSLIRRKTNNVVKFEKARGLLAAEFVHTSSRLAQGQATGAIPDPQLHSHVLLFAAERKDGKLAAIESKRLYQAARENGAWYRAQLAQNLKELGLQIERRTGKGERYFEIQGVPQELAERWSTRSEDVDRAAKLFRQRYGREPRGGELGSLTQGTRGSKTSADRMDVNEAWRALGEEHGLTQRRSQELFRDWGLETPKVDLRAELLPEVTRERATITERELKAKAYELSAGACAPAHADALINELIRDGELLRLEDGTWTTKQLREKEQRTIAIAEQRVSKDIALVSPESLRQARSEVGRQIKGSLTHEQREALETITGPGGISILIGQAGTGKGVVISAAARAWQLEGNQVIGTAVAGLRAQDLKQEAHLNAAYTADSLINKIQNEQIKLGPDTVIVMDEAAMADTERLEKLVSLTARADAKILLVGDSAQINSIGAGGIFKELEQRVPTTELTEIHRAHHDWERKAWEQVRAGQPGPALAQYQAHERLHIHDTREQAAEAMVANWDRTRSTMPDGRAVMLTDASNVERDQMNAMAQERRAQTGELGAHRVGLPGKPYCLAAGDELIFTAQFYPPGQERVENGISGTVIDADPDEEKVTIKTNELKPREINVNTKQFDELSLAYAVHAHKAQGITAETSGILIGGWQTDKEHAYVTVSRAREQTQIYVSREDLGEQGLDTGAMERLAERMANSRAQDASITKELAEREPAAPPLDREPALVRRQRSDDITDDFLHSHNQHDEPTHEQAQDQAPEPPREAHPRPMPLDILHANPKEVQINVTQVGDTQLAQTQVFGLEGASGEPTVALFGAWRSETEQGFTATITNGEHTEVRANNEPAGEREIETELRERVEQVIERAQTREQGNTRDASAPETGRERSGEQPARLEQPIENTPDEQPEREPIGHKPIEREPTHDRDPDIEQAIQEERDRQAEWERETAQPVADRSAEIHDPTIEPTPERMAVDRPEDRDREIQEAIDAERERQHNWEQGINPDERDLGFEID